MSCGAPEADADTRCNVGKARFLKVPRRKVAQGQGSRPFAVLWMAGSSSVVKQRCRTRVDPAGDEKASVVWRVSSSSDLCSQGYTRAWRYSKYLHDAHTPRTNRNCGSTFARQWAATCRIHADQRNFSYAVAVVRGGYSLASCTFGNDPP